MITGANGGIGSALAREFAKHGHQLLLHGRDADSLSDIVRECRGYGVNVEKITGDLSLSGSALKLYEEVKSRKLAVSYLVNNAGFGDFAAFENADIEKLHSMMMVNITSLTELCKLFVQDIVKYSGGILNVASTAAFLPGPLLAVYFASKAYVLRFSVALHEELKGRARVTALCPGPTKSGFQKLASMQKSKVMQGNIMKPYQVARAGYTGCMAGKSIVVPGFKNKLVTFMPRLLPTILVARLVHKAQSEK